MLATDQVTTSGHLGDAGIEVRSAANATITAKSSCLEVSFGNDSRRDFDVLYPVLGCEIHSDLAVYLGARRTPVGALAVDQNQQTSVPGLYAAGDVVADLHQICVAEGHAAIAATAIHNGLERNLR